ncbi:helix-turn-helix transcriptional regulator [Sporocytophaga myxococcoides]|uniref:helix-turn-helix transcriptional regulator n=1 Tax=Sporocytophaga myxococcoides TaxID=153721 RepID=UPI0005ED849E|nr:YafY family protein [Sporocytophaga myxococcoides]
MNRVDRLHAILTILQSKRVVKAEELATHFNLSIRTVYRDIRALEEGGIPIGAEAGVGYFLTDGFHLPPVMFTHEEARALLLAGKFIEQQTDQGTAKSFNDALTKVRAVIDNDKKDELDSLNQKILIQPYPNTKPTVEDLNLTLIKGALITNKILKLDYSTARETTERDVEPIGICFYRTNWHLIAYCRLRKDYRDFRLDRINKIKVSSETFLRIKHPTLKEYFDKMLQEEELFSVEIKVSKDILPHLQESKYTFGLIEENPEEDGTQMRFATYSLDYFARWILMMGNKVEILSPSELRDKTLKLVEDLSSHYLK